MNSYILVNYTEICKFHYVWVMFWDTFDNMKKTRLYGYVWLCSWFYSDSTDADDILNIII